MKLSWVQAAWPIKAPGEDGAASAYFHIDDKDVTDIEATVLGIVVRRKAPKPDLLITNGVGTLRDKPAGKPAFLK